MIIFSSDNSKLFDNVINALDTLGGSHSMFLYAQLSLSVALSMFNKYHVNLDMSHSYIACSHEIVYYAIINIFTYFNVPIRYFFLMQNVRFSQS